MEENFSDLQKSEQQLVEQERHQALTTMASGIAHDFNNALSPIQGLYETPALKAVNENGDENGSRVP